MFRDRPRTRPWERFELDWEGNTALARRWADLQTEQALATRIWEAAAPEGATAPPGPQQLRDIVQLLARVLGALLSGQATGPYAELARLFALEGVDRHALEARDPVAGVWAARVWTEAMASRLAKTVYRASAEVSLPGTADDRALVQKTARERYPDDGGDPRLRRVLEWLVLVDHAETTAELSTGYDRFAREMAERGVPLPGLQRAPQLSEAQTSRDLLGLWRELPRRFPAIPARDDLVAELLCYLAYFSSRDGQEARTPGRAPRRLRSPAPAGRRSDGHRPATGDPGAGRPAARVHPGAEQRQPAGPALLRVVDGGHPCPRRAQRSRPPSAAPVGRGAARGAGAELGGDPGVGRAQMAAHALVLAGVRRVLPRHAGARRLEPRRALATLRRPAHGGRRADGPTRGPLADPRGAGGATDPGEDGAACRSTPPCGGPTRSWRWRGCWRWRASTASMASRATPALLAGRLSRLYELVSRDYPHLDWGVEGMLEWYLLIELRQGWDVDQTVARFGPEWSLANTLAASGWLARLSAAAAPPEERRRTPEERALAQFIDVQASRLEQRTKLAPRSPRARAMNALLALASLILAAGEEGQIPEQNGAPWTQARVRAWASALGPGKLGPATLSWARSLIGTWSDLLSAMRAEGPHFPWHRGAIVETNLLAMGGTGVSVPAMRAGHRAAWRLASDLVAGGFVVPAAFEDLVGKAFESDLRRKLAAARGIPEAQVPAADLAPEDPSLIGLDAVLALAEVLSEIRTAYGDAVDPAALARRLVEVQVGRPAALPLRPLGREGLHPRLRGGRLPQGLPERSLEVRRARGHAQRGPAARRARPAREARARPSRGGGGGRSRAHAGADRAHAVLGSGGGLPDPPGWGLLAAGVPAAGAALARQRDHPGAAAKRGSRPRRRLPGVARGEGRGPVAARGLRRPSGGAGHEARPGGRRAIPRRPASSAAPWTGSSRASSTG